MRPKVGLVGTTGTFFSLSSHCARVLISCAREEAMTVE